MSSLTLLPPIEEGTESDEDMENDMGGGALPSEFDESILSSGKTTVEKIALPLTLLTAPLHPKKVAMLREKDKKLYNIQRAKYEVV